MSWVRIVALALGTATICGASLYASRGPQASVPQARAGWDAIREGRHDDAAAAFAAALDTQPRDPRLHLGAGLAAHLLGKPTAAQHELERALELAPSLTPASLLLGDILYRSSDITGAIRVYESAHKYAPSDKTLIARLESLRREAALHHEFMASHGTHFTVLFEGPADASVASHATDMLEAAYWSVSTALGIFPERTITVVLYTGEQFRDITRSPQWAAAAYDGRIRLPIRGADADLRELERVITHEFTHALVQSVAPRSVPLWLHEGLAVTFEPGGAAWSQEHLAKATGRLPLRRLAESFERLSGADARVAYAQSAAIVRTLFDRGGPLALGALLQDLARGETFAAAFEQRFFQTYDSFITSLETAY
jgi:tetratricopeptide (TPR) repeat protein